MRQSAVLSVIAAGLAVGCGSAETIDQRIPFVRDGTVEVDLDYGEGLRPDPGALRVTAHDLDEVHVFGESSGWGSWDVAFRVDQHESSVRVVASVNGATSWLFGGPQVQLRVRVPRETALDLRCSDGPVRIEDVHGSVRARTGDGRIEVLGVEGAVRLRTADGDIHASDVVGDVYAKASLGDLELRWIEGDVEARTGSGRIEAAHISGHLEVRTDRGEIDLDAIAASVEAKTERGGVSARFADVAEVSLETRRGSMEVLLPPVAGAHLDAVARGGDIELGDGLRLVADVAAASDGDGGDGAKRVQGEIDGGGPPLRLYTSRGRIRVGRR